MHVDAIRALLCWYEIGICLRKLKAELALAKITNFKNNTTYKQYYEVWKHAFLCVSKAAYAVEMDKTVRETVKRIDAYRNSKDPNKELMEKNAALDVKWLNELIGDNFKELHKKAGWTT